MKTRTVTERIGECLGPIDWSYDFRSHFKWYGSKEADGDAACAKAVEMLRAISSEGEWEATTDGGSPKFGWHRVLVTGMYDGWPYWRPIPAFASAGPLGTEWHFFDDLTGISRLDQKE